MDLFVVIWLVLIPIINGINVFIIGTGQHPLLKSSDDPFDAYFLPALGSFIWPMVFVLGLVISPFVGLYYLGKSSRR